MATANDALFDASVRHQIYLQRYSGTVVNKFVALLNRSDADVVDSITRRMASIEGKGFDSGKLVTKRLQALLVEIRELNAAAYAAAGKGFLDELRAFVEYEVEWQASTLDNALPEGVSITAPSANTVSAAVLSRPFQGRLLKEWLSGIEAAKAVRVRDAIRLGMVEGETIDQIVRRIRGTRAARYADGLMEIDRRGAAAMVRTAVNHVGSVAREAVALDNSDILKGERWTATLDGRTSAVCRGRDGTIYPVGNGPKPPAHIGCRSLRVPVLSDEFSDLRIVGERASQDGPVRGDETYQTWLRRQPDSSQDEVLGKAKALLFRDGNLSLDRFTNSAGDELTLDQLRKKEPAAFKKAGLAVGAPGGPRVSKPRSKASPMAPSASFEAARKDSIAFVRDNGARADREYAAAIADDGSTILRKRGQKTSVSFQVDEIARMNGATLIHNHPNASSLSLADLVFSKRANLREIVAVPSLEAGEFRATPLMDESQIKAAHEKADIYAKSVFTPAYKSGRISLDQLNHLHWHLVNSALSKEGVMSYIAEVMPSTLSRAISDFGAGDFDAAVEAFKWTP